jgi:GAF domain-containing protein
VAHVAELPASEDYIAGNPGAVAAVELGGVRTFLAVPMLKENELIGCFSLYRQEVRPFTDKQITLVTNFAAQAVIAIENARLLNELRQSLEQQTATSQVLQVISSSPGELEPVFRAMLENATRICEAKYGVLYRYDGQHFSLATHIGVGSRLVEFMKRGPIAPHSSTILGRMVGSKEVIEIEDARKEHGYLERHPVWVAGVEQDGALSLLGVPMLKENALVGAFVIFRQEVKLFTDKQIGLVKNFAAQAVIAIENARLLNELRQRTSDLSESLEQQTATSEVLQVVSSSPADLEPVFATMLEKAVRIGEAAFGNIYRWEGETGRLVATYNTPQAFAEERRNAPDWRPAPQSPVGRLLTTKLVVHVTDLASEEAYIKKLDKVTIAGVELGRVRTVLFVPMLKESELIGFFGIARQEVRPFTDKQIELVKNFAAQAVIAIENARLLNELRQRTTDLTEALEQQTATSEVLQVISSSPGELVEVFASMLERAVRICDATFGNIYRWDGTLLHLVASHNAPSTYVEYRKQKPFRADNQFGVARMINSKAPVHVTDLSDENYAEGVQLGEIKAFLAVPMLNGDDLLGAFIVSRKEARPFTEKQIALVHNFAAQAVIAIENTRLLSELRDRTEQVEKLNRHLEQRVTDQVGEIERMSRLRRFLPPQVADLIVASGTEKQLESHRREITALFCDLRGFTGFTESADAEDVIALLREYHAAVGEKIIKYSGTLERYAGDGVMVVFNDPVPVDNPALQAVLMALEMRDAIGSLTEKWRRLGHDIGFGIGIAHGFATLGTIGFEGRFDYAAIGTVSNVASRLCDEAKPGQILISPRVLMAIEQLVKVEAVGEFTLKGIRRPLAAYNVVAAAP